MIIKIKNWSSLQSYKDRTPPWIRFPRTLLDNYEFQMMSFEARAILPMLWLLASENDDPKLGVIDSHLEKMSFRLRIESEKLSTAIIELANSGFIELNQEDMVQCYESVTSPYPNRNETVTPETETETETETDTHVEFATKTGPREQKQKTAQVREIFEHWQSTMSHPKSKLDKQRRRRIDSALALGFDAEQLRLAITGCSKTPHNIGQNDSGQRYDGLNVIFKNAEQIERFIRNAKSPPHKGGAPPPAPAKKYSCIKCKRPVAAIPDKPCDYCLRTAARANTETARAGMNNIKSALGRINTGVTK